jgi:hypothetical protein
MNPYVEKFTATTKAYLQVVAGMTDSPKFQANKSAVRSRAVPCAILGGPFGHFNNDVAAQARENSALDSRSREEINPAMAYRRPVLVG